MEKYFFDLDMVSLKEKDGLTVGFFWSNYTFETLRIIYFCFVTEKENKHTFFVKLFCRNLHSRNVKI